MHVRPCLTTRLSVSSSLPRQPRSLLGLGLFLTGLALEPTRQQPQESGPREQPTIAQARAKLQAGDYGAAAGMLTSLTEAEPQNGMAWQLLGFAYHAQGDLERALPAHLAATKFPGSAPTGFYNAGCVHALQGRPTQAFQCLLQAEGTGAIDLARMDTDPDLASLRADPRYRDLRPTAESFARPFVEPTRILSVLDGEVALGQFGWIARRIGDVDGDGAQDFTTSAPSFVSGGGPAGRIYVYSSRSGALLWQQTGQPGDQLGLGIEAAGDVDADGTPDVIAGAPGRGAALVYSGKDGRVLHGFHGEIASGFGTRVSGLSDLDGDGHAELLVCSPTDSTRAPGAGHADVFSGKTGARLFALDGEKAGDRFGSACAGGSNGVAARIVVGAPDAGAGGRGRVHVFDGTGAPCFVIEAEPTGAELGGMFVSIVGDVDADGVGDIYASDWSDGAKGPTTGRIYVHSGKTGERLLVLAGEVGGEGFGIGPADAGDVDGDGHADLIVGAWQSARAASSGGRCALHSGKTGALLRTITCRVPGDTFGFDATGLGDVDGDGELDFLVTSGWSRVNGSRSGRVFVLAGEARAPGQR